MGGVTHTHTRKENYVAENGDFKSAICYTQNDKNLHFWFDYEQMEGYLNNWCHPDPPYYYSSHQYTGKLRAEHEKEEEKAKKSNEKNKSRPNSRSRNSTRYEDNRKDDNR